MKDKSNTENGIILVDKPAGISSFGVVAKVRGALKAQFGHKVKVGHTGTLDPFATGLLILLTGKMTKKSSEFLKLDKIYEKFLQLADQKKEVTDADVLMLAGADTAETHAVRLDFLQVTTGKGVKSVASIGLDISGQKFEAAASGNGPVDAAIKALKRIIMKQMTLKEFTIQAISKGSDDVGKVHMQVEYDGSLYYGFGANTDIVTASVEAYIDCINKFKK